MAPVQVLQQHLLFKVLPAADEDEIIARETFRRADGHFGDLRAEAAPAESLRQAADVAPVAVEIQYIRIKMTDFQVHNTISFFPKEIQVIFKTALLP